MNLNSICNIISAKIIPIKSLVECITPKGALKRGFIYEVMGSTYDKETINVREVGGNPIFGSSFFPSRFKFISAPTIDSGND